MTKSFWSRLVLPLTFLLILSLLIHMNWPAGGFFLNLATEIIGILITIGYVDWILKQHEKQRWLSTDMRIVYRLKILLNATVSGIRHGLGLSPDILDERIIASGNLNAIHNEIVRIADHVISPIVHQRVQALDPRGWKSLATHIANAHNGILVFLNAFQGRLSPDQVSNLLDLEEALSHSLMFYATFPDLAGVHKDELPQTHTPPDILQQSGYEATAKDLQRALAIIKILSQPLTQNS